MTEQHEHSQPPERLEDNPIWRQDNVELRSVGVDIGSSSTHVAFSRLHLQRRGADLTSRYVVVERETLYESDVELTPYSEDLTIDGAALGRLLDRAYAASGLAPADIDTGAVILTGEALRRRNAQQIATMVSVVAGDLVCASAGHHMEAMLAAYGSGAAQESHARGLRILNVDIGGGTTKFALVVEGRVEQTAAMHVGGRLHVFDLDRLARSEPAGRRLERLSGQDWRPGGRVEDSARCRVAATMAEAILAVAAGGRRPDWVDELFVTAVPDGWGEVDAVVFSGGVAEYVDGTERRDFGDLGRWLGAAITERLEQGALSAPVRPALHRIRATVLGACEYTVQLSGVTSFVSHPEASLPRRNVQVVRPAYQPPDSLDDGDDGHALAAAIRARLETFGVADTDDVALALTWSGPPRYARVRAFGQGIVAGLAGRAGRGRPWYVVLDGDLAMTLGRLLRDELGVRDPLVVLDGIWLREFDYVDLGAPRQPSGTVPVTIKSLVFQADPVGS